MLAPSDETTSDGVCAFAYRVEVRGIRGAVHATPRPIAASENEDGRFAILRRHLRSIGSAVVDSEWSDVHLTLFSTVDTDDGAWFVVRASWDRNYDREAPTEWRFIHIGGDGREVGRAHARFADSEAIVTEIRFEAGELRARVGSIESGRASHEIAVVPSRCESRESGPCGVTSMRERRRRSVFGRVEHDRDAARTKVSGHLASGESFLSVPIPRGAGWVFVGSNAEGSAFLRAVDAEKEGGTRSVPIALAAASTRDGATHSSELVVVGNRSFACIATPEELVVVDDEGNRRATERGRFLDCDIDFVEGRLVVVGRLTTAIRPSDRMNASVVTVDVGLPNGEAITRHFPEFQRAQGVSIVRDGDFAWMLVRDRSRYMLTRLVAPTEPTPAPAELATLYDPAEIAIVRRSTGPALAWRTEQATGVVPFCSIPTGHRLDVDESTLPDFDAIRHEADRIRSTYDTLESTYVDPPTVALAYARQMRVREIGTIDDHALVELAENTVAWLDDYRRLPLEERVCPPELSPGHHCFAHQLLEAIRGSRDAIVRHATSATPIDHLRDGFGRPEARPDRVCALAGISDPAILTVLEHEYELEFTLGLFGHDTFACRRVGDAVIVDRVERSADGRVVMTHLAEERVELVPRDCAVEIETSDLACRWRPRQRRGAHAPLYVESKSDRSTTGSWVALVDGSPQVVWYGAPIAAPIVGE